MASCGIFPNPLPPLSMPEHPEALYDLLPSCAADVRPLAEIYLQMTSIGLGPKELASVHEMITHIQYRAMKLGTYKDTQADRLIKHYETTLPMMIWPPLQQPSYSTESSIEQEYFEINEIERDSDCSALCNIALHVSPQLHSVVDLEVFQPIVLMDDNINLRSKLNVCSFSTEKEIEVGDIIIDYDNQLTSLCSDFSQPGHPVEDHTYIRQLKETLIVKTEHYHFFVKKLQGVYFIRGTGMYSVDSRCVPPWIKGTAVAY